MVTYKFFFIATQLILRIWLAEKTVIGFYFFWNLSAISSILFGFPPTLSLVLAQYAYFFLFLLYRVDTSLRQNAFYRIFYISEFVLHSVKITLIYTLSTIPLFINFYLLQTYYKSLFYPLDALLVFLNSFLWTIYLYKVRSNSWKLFFYIVGTLFIGAGAKICGNYFLIIIFFLSTISLIGVIRNEINRNF
jgi:hypothetical protein